MSEQQRNALLIYHAEEIQKLLSDIPKTKKLPVKSVSVGDKYEAKLRSKLKN